MTMQKHNLVSGGGSGLGLGLAKLLLRRGGKLSILDLQVNDDNRRLLDQSAAAGGGQWQYFQTDISDASQVDISVKAAVAAFGLVDVAINSAGIAINKRLENTSAEEFAKVISINLNGSFNFSHALLPVMQAGGRLALMASMAGLVSMYGYSAYSASKFGVVSLTQTLRQEFLGKDIKIICICPPEVKTPLVAAEKIHGDRVSIAMKQFLGSLEADEVCEQMLRGIDRGQKQIIPGGRAKATAVLSRHFPAVFTFTMGIILRGLQFLDRRKA